MFVCRFGVKVSDDFAIVKWKVGIEKGYGCEGIVAWATYGGVDVIEEKKSKIELILLPSVQVFNDLETWKSYKQIINLENINFQIICTFVKVGHNNKNANKSTVMHRNTF